MRVTGAIALALLLGGCIANAQPKETPLSPAIENGSTVKLEYTLTDDAGKVLDSNRGQDPLTYRHGQEEILPALENALKGMHAGDHKDVTLPPADGYGDVDPKALTEVPKELIPPESLKVGAELVARSPVAGPRLVRVKEIKEKTVVIDLNHPLAGKTLHFDVTVLGVEPAQKVEPPKK